MFVITADQVGSRSHRDRVADVLAAVNRRHLLLPAERTAGDEFQLVTDDGATALELILELTRSGEWSVGCGIGAVELPLPSSTREAIGSAFIAARTAVDRAKRSTGRASIVSLAAASPEATEPPASPDATAAAARRPAPAFGAEELQALLDLLLTLRERRSEPGWELSDLLDEGITQAEAAERLGISPQAASRRAQVAALRVEEAAVAALARLMSVHDRELVGAASAMLMPSDDAGEGRSAGSATDSAGG